MFNNLYAENVSFFGIYFVFSQNKSVKLFIAPIYNKVSAGLAFGQAPIYNKVKQYKIFK